MNFGGPYPQGHYNLVDKRTRYPEVERLYSTAIPSTKEKLKKIFAAYGMPVHLELTTDHHSVQERFLSLQLKKDLGITESHLCIREPTEKQKAL